MVFFILGERRRKTKTGEFVERKRGERVGAGEEYAQARSVSNRVASGRGGRRTWPALVKAASTGTFARSESLLLHYYFSFYCLFKNRIVLSIQLIYYHLLPQLLFYALPEVIREAPLVDGALACPTSRRHGMREILGMSSLRGSAGIQHCACHHRSGDSSLRASVVTGPSKLLVDATRYVLT